MRPSGTTETPAARTLSGRRWVMSTPSIETVPPVVRSSPAIAERRGSTCRRRWDRGSRSPRRADAVIDTSRTTVCPPRGDRDAGRSRARSLELLLVRGTPSAPRDRGAPREVGPDDSSRPKSSTAVHSQHALTRLMSCSTSTTIAPTCSGIALITAPRCSVSASGSPAPGSSSRTDSRRADDGTAPPRRAGVAAATACRPAANATSPSPTNSIASSTAARRVGARLRGVLVARQHVVVHRQRLDRLLGLERSPQTPAGPCVVGHRQQVVAERGDASRRRAHESGQHVEERRLAGAVRTDQAARPARERDASSG